MHCLNCGYSLKDLRKAKCPECGRGFDPLNPSTYSASTRSKPLGRINGLLMAILLPLSLSVVMVAGGHGAGFVYMLFGHERMDVVALALYLLVAVASAFVRNNLFRCILLLLCLAGALAIWTWLMCLTEYRGTTLYTSIPFLVCVSLMTTQLALAMRRGAPLGRRR